MIVKKCDRTRFLVTLKFNFGVHMRLKEVSKELNSFKPENIRGSVRDSA